MLVNRIKLCKALLKLAEIATDKGNLIYEGELVVGIEVFVDQDGEIVPANDGVYVSEDKQLTIEAGKVVAIEPIAVEEPKVEEKAEAEEPSADASKVAELEAVIVEKDAKIKELEAKVAELEDQLTKQDEKLKMSSEKPAKEKVKETTHKTGLKFYQFQ
jgi:hypothetical protein